MKSYETRKINRLFKTVMVSWKLAVIAIKNIFSYISLLISKLFSYSGQRVSWFSAIVLFVLIYVATSIVMYTDITQVKILGHAIPHIQIPSSPWYLRFTIFAPIAIILGLAYSFAVKNYRIYCNMLDQYMHRKSVAETSQGIIASLKGSEDSSIRDNLTAAAAAAAALFEHRNTGHLSKKEAESLSVLEMFKLFQK